MTQMEMDRIIDSIDFDKIQKVMESLNHTWRGEGAPTIDKMKDTVRYLLNTMDTSDSSNVSTGGFHCYRMNFNGDKQIHVLYSPEFNRYSIG